MKTYWKHLHLRCIGLALCALVVAAPAPAHCGLLDDILNALGQWFSGAGSGSGNGGTSQGGSQSSGSDSNSSESSQEPSPTEEEDTGVEPIADASGPSADGSQESETEAPPDTESPPGEIAATPASNPSGRLPDELAVMIARDAGGHADQYAAYSEKLAETLSRLTQEQRTRVFGGQ